MHGDFIREIRLKDAKGEVNATWTPDGKALLVTEDSCAKPSICIGRGRILRVTLDGGVQGLLEHGSNISFADTSPDGRHIAIMLNAGNRNVWMMENF